MAWRSSPRPARRRPAPRSRGAQLPDVPGRQRLEHQHLAAAGRSPQRGVDGQHGQRHHLPAPGLRALGRSHQPLRHPLHRGVARAARWSTSSFQYSRRERSRALPVRRRHADRGRRAVDGRPPRHHGQPEHVHPLRALRRPRTAPSGSTAGSGAIWNLNSNALRPSGWTSADAAGLPDPARAAALRRGAVGQHHPRHPHDGRDHGQRVHLAGPPRGRARRATPTSPRWARASGSRRASTSRATRPRPRSSCGPCSSTA